MQRIRSDRRVMDPEKWIITENHHEPIVDRETFDRVQARFGKRKHSWKRKSPAVSCRKKRNVPSGQQNH